MNQVRINVSTLVNASKIRREKRHGRDVIIVPSATLPDNIIMNGQGGPGGAIKYPAEEIERAFKGLEQAPAPLGHPMVNGKFVSARSPEGLARSYVGAHNENVRREGGRVLLDKVIDVAVANQSEGGRALLSAIEKQEPIHTSTGLLAVMELANAADHKYVARSMYFDHDAILLNEAAAAGPDKGVGMFVNSAGEEMEVVNSAIPEQELPKEEIMLRNRFLSLIDTIIRGSPEPETVANQETSPMDKEQFDALSGEVKALSATVAGLPEVLANALKPVIEAQEAIANAAKEKADAEHAALVNQVVTAELLDEATAKATPAATLTVLANSIVQRPKVAFRVNAAMANSEKTDIASLAPKGD